MASQTVKEIEQAIETLSAAQLAELYAWLDQRYPQTIDVRLQKDLAEGSLDNALERALEDEKEDRIRPL